MRFIVLILSGKVLPSIREVMPLLFRGKTFDHEGKTSDGKGMTLKEGFMALGRKDSSLRSKGKTFSGGSCAPMCGFGNCLHPESGLR